MSKQDYFPDPEDLDEWIKKANADILVLWKSINLGSLEPKKGNSMNEHTLNTDRVVSNDPELAKAKLDVVQERTDVTEGLVSEDTGEVQFSQTEEELGKEDETTLVL